MTKEIETHAFNQEVDRYHKCLLSYVRGIFYNLKREYGLTNDELALVFGVEEEEMTNFLNEKWEGYISSKVLSILYLLLEDKFDLSKVIYKKPDSFNDTAIKYIELCSSDRYERNVMELLSVLGIENNNDLETVIKFIRETLNTKKHNV